jgi:hypothetical protein
LGESERGRGYGQCREHGGLAAVRAAARLFVCVPAGADFASRPEARQCLEFGQLRVRTTGEFGPDGVVEVLVELS